MVGENLANNYLKEMKKNLLTLWETTDERKRKRYVAIIDSINLLIAHLDQELQIATRVDIKIKEEKHRIIRPN